MATYVTNGFPNEVRANDRENIYYAIGESSINNNGISNATAISPTLAAMFDQVNDVRYAGFMDKTTSAVGGATGNTDQQYAPAWNPSKAGVNRYWINPAGVRTTEVILMLAECCAREQNYTEMNKYLDEVRSKRLKNFTATTYIPSGKTEAVNIVINERRKELLFAFHRFFDLRRLNTEAEFKQTLSRTIPANPALGPAIPQRTCTLAPDSPFWIICFPVEELQRNKNLQNNTPW